MDSPLRSRGRTQLVLLLWALAIALCYAGLGRFLDESITGITPEQLSSPLALAAVASVVLALAATLFNVGRRRPAQAEGAESSGRRRFLLAGVSALAGLAASGLATLARPRGWITTTGPAVGPRTPTTTPNPSTDWQGARIQSYRTLGRTGFQVSDISLGSARVRGELGEKIAREAIERGVNYFDTSPDYSEAGSELALGRAMKGHRDEMFLATKFCTPDGHLQAGASVQQYMSVVEESLGRLQTDHVDLVHVHACDTLERLLDPNLHEAFGRLREQGKARFLGFSSHTPNLERVSNAAIDDGRFDVMMLAYHHGAWPNLRTIIDRASASGMGVVAMKTLKGAKHRGLTEFRPPADSFPQAAFKWVLGNPSVACLVISFYEPAQVDEYLYASGKTLTEQDLALLERYDQLVAGTQCRPHCGECLTSCPHGVPIDDVLRHRMYFEDYGDQKQAMRLYARLERKADLCIGCSAPCTGACPHGIAIQQRTLGAHEMLSFG